MGCFRLDSCVLCTSAEDASVEIAICQLLLGRQPDALATLGVLPGAAASADADPDTGILEFIQVEQPQQPQPMLSLPA